MTTVHRVRLSGREERPLWQKWDLSLVLVTLAVTALGVLMVYSATRGTGANGQPFNTSYLKRQVVFAGGGVGLMALLAFVDYRRLREVLPLLYLGTLALLAAVLVAGVTVNGAKSWFAFGGFQLQPSEPGKIVVILALGFWFGAESSPPGLRRLAVGLANATGDVIDHGRIGPNSIAGLVTPFIPGLTGDNTLDQILVGAARTLGHVAAGRRLGFADFLSMAGPALLGADATPESIARSIQSGRLPMDQFGGLLSDFLRRFVDDPADMQAIRTGLEVLAKGIDSKRLDPAAVLAALQPYFEESRLDRRAA